MILVAVLLSLAFLQNASGGEWPRFRSSWNDGGGPILREEPDPKPDPEPNPEPDPEQKDVTAPPKPPAPKWLEEFKAFTRFLIEKYGLVRMDLRPVVRYLEYVNKVFINDIIGIVIDYEAIPENDPESEPEPESEPKPEPEPEPEPESEPEPEPEQ